MSDTSWPEQKTKQWYEVFFADEVKGIYALWCLMPNAYDQAAQFLFREQHLTDDIKSLLDMHGKHGMSVRVRLEFTGKGKIIEEKEKSATIERNYRILEARMGTMTRRCKIAWNIAIGGRRD